MPRHWRTWTVAAVALLASAAVAQERDPSSPYFECPYINYFDNGCPQAEQDPSTILSEVEGSGARVGPPAEAEHEQPETIEELESEYDWMQEAPEDLLPLFPRESVAPDTPPLYHLLLMKPTLENARRYVRWYARRMNRIREAQGLVDIAGREFLAERAAGE